ncbi:MAG TPA: TIGR03086 family metal-binding protein [Acidimicrobiales bacterium]|nr:TIGR03086 family metal-binding protein [Acidimicrobiales bacterium]
MESPPLQIASEGFERRLDLVAPEDWDKPTPCGQWSVRELVNHVAAELLWMPSLFQGRTIAEVGDRFDGDVLGSDPVGTWRSAAADAAAASSEEGALERIVHLSFGDFPGQAYAGQVTSDVIIHTWDLARAIGVDDQLGDEPMRFLMSFLDPQIEEWRNAGAFGPASNDDGDGSDQDRFLARTGRSPRWPDA